LLRTQEGFLLVILLLAMGVLALMSDRFLTVRNLLNLSRLFVEVGCLV
jgi:ribose/xylose/arabinose/galactoside ABC-type transport system permease subunit